MLNDEEILFKLCNISMLHDIKLTLTNKIFFLKLLKYMIENGEEDFEKYSVIIKVKEMSDIFDISPRMITHSLKRLTKCGVVERIPVEYGSQIHGMKTIIYKSLVDDMEKK